MGSPWAPNQIYVIPPQADLTIAQGVLHLQRRADRHGSHMPIDAFLHTLAANQQERAIGVILSGTGSDGTQGLRAIKAAGGITVAQEPPSAKYDGMPRSAIAAGVVDLVLPPEDMVREIVRIGQNPARTPAQILPGDAALPAGTDDLNTIFFLLRRASGIDFSNYKPATITRRIKRRMALHQIEKLAGYVRYLQTTPAELDALYQDLLIDVTGFFRDPEVFAALKEVVFPRLALSTNPETPIRVWVPGCASGEEAYSIAICLLEFFGERASTPPVQMFATDINEAALVTARAGVYPERIAQDVSGERLRRFFTRTETGYQISKPIRDLCVFARQDVTRDPPFSRLDLISCRNLLIYLNVALQKRLIALFHFALKPSGSLVLGTSETIGAASDLFSLADHKHKIYVRKSTPLRLKLDFSSGLLGDDLAEPVGRVSGSPGGEIDLQRDIDRMLLGRYVPPAVVVNDALQIVQFRGSTGAYLDPLPGTASLDLLRLARGDLLIDLRTAINTARRDNVAVRKAGIRHRVQDQIWTTTIDVIPVHHAPSGERYFIVAFADATAPTPAAPAADSVATTGSQEPEQEPIHALQQELTITREQLQLTIEEHVATTEELRAANEEIQSSNEELQSTNEELETAKEELQSTNEEITTVNEELHNRNLELSQSNNDLINLLGIVNIPIVMVSNNLRIRRFTPMAEQVLSLLPSDIGRPLSDLRPKIDVPDLDRLIAAVIDTLTPCEREVQGQDGHWYTLRIRPYRTIEHRIEGAVVVLVDVTDLKRATLEAQAARDYAEAIVETVREPLIVLDQDLRVQTANRAFYTMFHVTPVETEQRFIFAIGNGQWDIPELHWQLTETWASERVFQDFVVEHTFPQIGQRTMRLNARKIARKDVLQLILLAIEDITAHPAR
jgi:two-component system, chemotaxis family, CheB/CheR fusion protein